MTYDYAHLICFSPTHSSHMIGETVLQGLGTGHVSETDLTYEKPEENLTIHSGITVIVVPVYGGRIAETALERMEGIYGQDSPAVAVVVYGNGITTMLCWIEGLVCGSWVCACCRRCFYR